MFHVSIDIYIHMLIFIYLSIYQQFRYILARHENALSSIDNCYRESRQRLSRQLSIARYIARRYPVHDSIEHGHRRIISYRPTTKKNTRKPINEKWRNKKYRAKISYWTGLININIFSDKGISELFVFMKMSMRRGIGEASGRVGSSRHTHTRGQATCGCQPTRCATQVIVQLFANTIPGQTRSPRQCRHQPHPLVHHCVAQ